MNSNIFDVNSVTKEDFLLTYGINLDIELPYDDDEGNKSARFIWRVENEVQQMLNKYCECPITEENKKYYQNGLLAQINFTLNNGFGKGLDSTAKEFFRQGGFMNYLNG